MPLKVRGTYRYVHEMKTQLKRVGGTKVVISWKKDELSDDANYRVASHRGWQTRMVLDLYVRRWEAKGFYRSAKQHPE